MKITRILTYEFDEDDVREFYGSQWWKNKMCVNEDDFDYYIDALKDEGYDDEEIIYEKGTREKMMQIWQKECDKYCDLEEEEETFNDIQYYKDKIAYLENKIKALKVDAE